MIHGSFPDGFSIFALNYGPLVGLRSKENFPISPLREPGALESWFPLYGEGAVGLRVASRVSASLHPRDPSQPIPEVRPGRELTPQGNGPHGGRVPETIRGSCSGSFRRVRFRSPNALQDAGGEDAPALGGTAGRWGAGPACWGRGLVRGARWRGERRGRWV